MSELKFDTAQFARHQTVVTKEPSSAFLSLGNWRRMMFRIIKIVAKTITMLFFCIAILPLMVLMVGGMMLFEDRN
jgi:hypothetical protein